MCHGVDHSQPGFGFLFRLYAAPRFFVDSALMTTTNTLSTLIRLLLWCGFADNMPACLSHASTTERSAALQSLHVWFLFPLPYCALIMHLWGVVFEGPGKVRNTHLSCPIAV